MERKNGHGGAREGAGRKKGRPSLRRAADAIAEVAAAFPLWSPVLYFATVANDESLSADIRLDAAKAAAPYLHARPKPVELEPDAIVELEKRLILAKIEASATALDNPSLAERLQRAKARIIIDTGISRAPDGDVGFGFDDPIDDPAPAPAPRPSETQPRAESEPATEVEAAAKAPDWAQPAPYVSPLAWPERQDFVDTDYENYSAGLLAGRNRD